MFIRGHIHLIPGHPSINNEANTLFGAYQKQASEGIIQFRRWPLRTVSLLVIRCRVLSRAHIIATKSTNVGV
jgi:hypothetical protein